MDYNATRFGAPVGVGGGKAWASALEQQENTFWGQARWYDLQVEQRMPLAKDMLDELLLALPPCSERRVLDLCAGAGRAAKKVLEGYPEAQVTLVDMDAKSCLLAQQQLQGRAGRNVRVCHSKVYTHGVARTAGFDEPRFHVVVASLALRQIMELTVIDRKLTVTSRRDVLQHYLDTLASVRETLLEPGGHLFVCDHQGAASAFEVAKLLDAAGYDDVDVAWKKDNFFVVVGRNGRPTDPVDVEDLSRGDPAAQRAELAAAHAGSGLAGAWAPDAASSSTAAAARSAGRVGGGTAAAAVAAAAPAPAPMTRYFADGAVRDHSATAGEDGSGGGGEGVRSDDDGGDGGAMEVEMEIDSDEDDDSGDGVMRVEASALPVAREPVAVAGGGGGEAGEGPQVVAPVVPDRSAEEDEEEDEEDEEDDEEDQEIEVEEDSDSDDSDDDEEEDDDDNGEGGGRGGAAAHAAGVVDMVSWAKSRNDGAFVPEDVRAQTAEQLAARAAAAEVALLERCLRAFYARSGLAKGKSDEVVHTIATKFAGKRDTLVRFLAQKYEDQYDALREMRNTLFPDD